MIYLNGRLPKQALYTVQVAPRIQANQPTAHDYKRFKKAAARVGIALRIPQYGGYRDILFQALLKANPRKYGSTLTPNEIADPGFTKHGDAIALDVYAKINLRGRAKRLTADRAWLWTLHNMGTYGFKQRDAHGDPHCLVHNG